MRLGYRCSHRLSFCLDKVDGFSHDERLQILELLLVPHLVLTDLLLKDCLKFLISELKLTLRE